MYDFLIVAAIILFIYLLPTFIAFRRRHSELVEIILLNIVLGWTLLGWVFCLFKACRNDGGAMSQASKPEQHSEYTDKETKNQDYAANFSGLADLKTHLSESVKIFPRIILYPVRFFRSMPKSGGFLGPLIFAVFMGVVAGIVRLMATITSGDDTIKIIVQSTDLIVIGPAISVILCFGGAAILHMFWFILGSRETYETSFRCMAYSFAVFPILMLINSSPVWTLIARISVFYFYLIIISESVHNILKIKARLFFALLGTVNVIFYILFTKVHIFAD